MPGGCDELAMWATGARWAVGTWPASKECPWSPEIHGVTLGGWPELNEGAEFEDRVAKASAGQALIDFYAARHPHSGSRAGWLKRILAGQVSVHGLVCTDPGLALQTGMRLVYRRVPWREPEAPCSLEVLWEDEELLVIGKPPGLQVPTL